MATNIYDYDERWYFDPKEPTAYYGWAVMTTSEQFAVAHFKRPERREEMVTAVKKVVPKLDYSDAELLAFVLLYERLEHDEVYFLLDGEMDEVLGDEAKSNELREIAEDFANNYD